MTKWMSIASLCRALVVLGVGVSAWSCSAPPETYTQIGAYCESDDACHDWQRGTYVPGSVCVSNQCVCPSKQAYCAKPGAVDGDADVRCRPAADCNHGDPSSSSAASSGAGGAGGSGGASVGGGGAGGSGGSGGAEVMPECSIAEDCPAPPDKRCGKATCIDQKCGFEFEPIGPLTAQIAGDCKTLFCDSLGGVLEFEDPGDVYNDGKQCTVDLCQDGQPVHLPFPEGLTCPESGSGYCSGTECVQCVDTILITYCSNLVCTLGVCTPPHCINNLPDPPAETDTDCGGPCLPCLTGQHCLTGADCMDGVCSPAMICEPPSPTDGIMNDGETDVDCGGPNSNDTCDDGKNCAVHADCKSSVCWAGKCQPPTCFDGILNGGEVSADCGGGCDAGCQ